MFRRENSHYLAEGWEIFCCFGMIKVFVTGKFSRATVFRSKSNCLSGESLPSFGAKLAVFLEEKFPLEQKKREALAPLFYLILI